MAFKECNLCGYEWDSRDAFLDDENVALIGYQVNFEDLTLGILLFNHSCRGTLAITAEHFSDIYDGPIFRARATGSDQCPGFCLHQRSLKPCPAQCECAYIREIIKVIESRQKVPGAPILI